MKRIIATLITCLTFALAFGQTTTNPADCEVAVFGCTINDFTAGIGQGNFNDLPAGNNVSNPSTNPGSAGNAGCLLSNELNPTWMIFTIQQDGWFEFTLGSPGSGGFYDWSLWPYYQAGQGTLSNDDACADITNNLLPPVACNWNGSSAGYTGMAQPGNLPTGAVAANFENAIWVTAGDQYVLCFSNFSGLQNQLVPVYTGTDIPGNSGSTTTASVTCDPSALGSTVCLGDTAIATLDLGGIDSNYVSFNILNNASDLVSSANWPELSFLPSDTTEYFVELSDTTGIYDTVSFIINVLPPVFVDAGLDTAICLGTIASLQGTPSDPNNDFQWTASGPATPFFTPGNDVVDPNFQTLGTGWFTLYLTESNGVCPDYTDSVMVYVSNPVVQDSLIDPSCNGFADGEIYLDSAGNDQYSFDGGQTYQTDNFMLGLTAGTYDVEIVDTLGCVADAQVVLVDPAPVVLTVSNDTTVCENGTATMLASATGGSAFVYAWGTSANTNATEVYNPTATSYVTVMAYNQNMCPSPMDSILVTVNPPLSGTLTPDQDICPGYPASLLVTGSGGNGGPYTYTWVDGAGNPVGSTDTYSANPATTTTYTAIVTDGCESTPFPQQVTITVLPEPDVQFSANQTEACAPGTFVLTNDTDPNMVGNWYWNLSNDSSYTNVNPLSVTLPEVGGYDVQLIVESPDGCIDSLTYVNFLNVMPIPQADFSYNSPIYMFTPEAQLNNASVDAVSYQWIISQGNPGTSTATNPIVMFPDGETGDYEVMLIATSDIGCVDTIVKVVTVEPEVIMYAPNTFTPDGDEYNNSWRVFVEGIDLYSVELTMYNRWGEVIWQSNDIEIPWDGTYNGQPVPNGIYTWSFTARNKQDDAKFTRTGYVQVMR